MRDSIREAMNSTSTADSASAETEAPNNDTQGESVTETGSTARVPAEQPRGPDGKFAAKPKLEVGAPPAVTKLEAPQHWSQEDKDWFTGMPDDVWRQKWLDKTKSLEGGYNTKFQEIANW